LAIADPSVAQCRRDAQLDPPRDGHSVDTLPPPPPHPFLGYAPSTQGPLFPDARPHHAPTSRGLSITINPWSKLLYLSTSWDSGLRAR
jgi:hypothetical protein